MADYSELPVLAIVGAPVLSMLIIPGMILAKVGKKLYGANLVARGIVEQGLSLIRNAYSYVGEERTV
ncbi:LOW QUALITY PROTEIN: hypothetical protein LguiB_022917 [Lonicera macranthoides]